MCTERKTGEERFIISEEGKMCEVVREIEWYNIQWLILFTNLLVPINSKWQLGHSFLIYYTRAVKWGRRRDVEETACDWRKSSLTFLERHIPGDLSVHYFSDMAWPLLLNIFLHAIMMNASQMAYSTLQLNSSSFSKISKACPLVKISIVCDTFYLSITLKMNVWAPKHMTIHGNIIT